MDRAEIERLETEATTAGDFEMVEVCRRALAGDAAALAKCKKVAADARAQITYENETNLAAFAVVWTSPSGVEYRLMNPRNTRVLLLCVKTDEGRWIDREMPDPGRFGMGHEPPVSWRVFRQIAETFIYGVSDDDDNGG